MISTINNLINSNAEILAKFENQISKNQKKHIELEKYILEIQETIANLYSCLRLFKKANIKIPLKERSELAISAVMRTQNTLKSIYRN